MKEAIRALLAADGALSGLLPGGVFASPEVSRQDTPAAYDADSELQTCANVKLETNGQVGPHKTGARQFFTVSLYQQHDTADITSAAARVIELLNDSKPTALIYAVVWTDTIPDLQDNALVCNLIVVRFVAHHRIS